MCALFSFLRVSTDPPIRDIGKYIKEGQVEEDSNEEEQTYEQPASEM